MFKFVGKAILAAAFGAVAMAGTAQASNTGTIRLQGTVQDVCQVSVTDAGVNLDLEAGERAREVATINETCNDYDGYTISFASSNKGKLKSNDGVTIDYTIDYDKSRNARLNRTLNVQRSKAQFRQTYPLKVSLDSSNSRIAGTYTDTVTVTVRAK